MKLLKNKTIIDLVFIFVLSLTPLLWFRDNSIMAGHDNIFPLNPILFLQGRLFTWISHNFGHNQVLIMGTIPIHFIDSFPTILGFSLQATQKIVYVFWFFSMGVSAYFLAKTINNTRVFKLTSVVLLLFNFFILNGWFIGERTKFSAYITLFLTLAVFVKVYKGELKVKKGIFYNALIFFFFNAGGLFGISLYGGFLLALISFSIFFSFINVFRKKIEIVKRILKLFFLSGIVFVFVNAYYLLPGFFQAFSQYSAGLIRHGGISGFIDWASEISAFASYSNIFRLQGIAEWYDNPFHPYSWIYLNNLWFILASFLWPIFIFITIYIYKKREKVELILFFLFVYLLGIIFTAGTHPPFGFIYSFLMNNIPGFIMFRSPYFKFAPALFLSSSFLIAYFFDYLKGKKRIFLTSLFIIVVLLYHFPYFAGTFFDWKKGYSTRVTIPSYIFEFDKWINNEKKDDLRVLVLPPNDPAFQYNAYTWGYLSFQSLPTLISNEPVVVNNDQLNFEEEKLLLMLYGAIGDNNQELADKLLSILRVRYILVQKDKVIDAGASVSSDVNTYENFASSNGNLLKSFGEWSVYELYHFPLPPFYATNSTNALRGSVNDVEIYFSQSDSTFFVLGSDIPSILAEEFPISSSFYVPECLNCPDSKSKPVVQFPKANILPDSPFYPLVLFKENQTLKNDTGTSRVYNDIGISLKRISEMTAIGIRDGKVPDSVLQKYDDLLKKTYADFNDLTKIEEKRKVADDINYYMNAQRGYLFQTLDAYVTAGHSITLDFAKVYESISNLLSSINPFFYKLDSVNNREYKISVDHSGEFEIILKKDELVSLLKKDSQLRIGIDEKYFKEIRLDVNSLNVSWFSFGKINLTKGVHYMSLSFPEPSNLSRSLGLTAIDFNFYSETNCYASKVERYSNRRLYRVKIDYINDFASDLVFYIWEQKGKSSKLINLAKLKPGLIKEEYQHYVKATDDSSNLWAGVCSNGLNNEIVVKKINIVSQEIITPQLLLKPVTQPDIVLKNVTFKKMSPVKYHISFENSENFAILNFMERFDGGWSLQDFGQNHYKGGGYENSWLIDKKGKFDLTLEYKPQLAFLIGLLVSALSLSASIGYVVYSKLKERYD